MSAAGGRVSEAHGTTIANVGGRMDVGPQWQILFQVAEDRQRVEVRVGRNRSSLGGSSILIVKTIDLSTTLGRQWIEEIV